MKLINRITILYSCNLEKLKNLSFKEFIFINQFYLIKLKYETYIKLVIADIHISDL